MGDELFPSAEMLYIVSESVAMVTRRLSLAEELRSVDQLIGARAGLSRFEDCHSKFLYWYSESWLE